jgi:hypothetical protein
MNDCHFSYKTKIPKKRIVLGERGLEFFFQKNIVAKLSLMLFQFFYIVTNLKII